MKKMPVLFAGHGSPMMALEDTPVTQQFIALGKDIRMQFGTPKAILAISAHWYTPDTYVQTAKQPRQIYDMYGFPEELYRVVYPVQGCLPLSKSVQSLLGHDVTVNDEWGIDHGTWTVLVHLFPEADIPVVQLSVAQRLTTTETYAIGERLAPLRDEGYLIVASGNIVHNLARVEWHMRGGSPMAEEFSNQIRNAVVRRADEAVLQYTMLPQARYAVPVPDHFMPLVYVLGATKGEVPQVFNDHCELGALSMTGFAFGMDKK